MMELLRPLGKGVLKRILYLNNSVSSSYWGKPDPGYAVVLQYHSVSSDPCAQHAYINPSLSIAVPDFDRQMAFARRHFEVVSLTRLIEYVQNGHKGSKPPLAVTFDDGYRDNYLCAFPVLRKYSIPATFYLTTECIDGRTSFWTSELRYLILSSPRTLVNLLSLGESYLLDSEEGRLDVIRDIKRCLVSMPRAEREEVMIELREKSGLTPNDIAKIRDIMLNWDEVRAMQHADMEFGSHTLSHPSLPYIPIEEARAEIVCSKKILEERLGRVVNHFSYPNPGGIVNFNATIQHLVKEAGYISATTSVSGHVTKGSDRFALRRKGIYKAYSRLPEFSFWIQKEAIVNAWHGVWDDAPFNSVREWMKK